MNIILMLIPLTLVLVLVAGWGFFWAVETGQFDDLDSPGWDVLVDDVATCTVPVAGNSESFDEIGRREESP
jgi:cbb3-type cytochrome oxidase maturation protein